MRDTSPSLAMQHAERLIREACSSPNPASRTEDLMRAYRLASGDVQHALVMGLIARVAMEGVRRHDR